MVLDVAVQPELGVEEEAPSEESPLLSSKVTLNKDPVTCSELLHLIPEGPPQVRRNISNSGTKSPPKASQLQDSSQPWGTPHFSPAEAPGSPHRPSPALVLQGAGGEETLKNLNSTLVNLHSKLSEQLVIILEEFMDWAFPC